MFDQGRGFERGEGREFDIPLMAFFSSPEPKAPGELIV